MAVIALFFLFLFTRIVVADIALNPGVIVRFMAFITKDKSFAVHVFNIFVYLSALLFDVAFIAPHRALLHVCMAFNAGGMKHLCPFKPLMAVGAFFYTLIIPLFMMACPARDISFFMTAVRHPDPDSSFKGLYAAGCIGFGIKFVNAGYSYDVNSFFFP